MATDFLDFLPLTEETIDSIRARLDLDVNAGIVPGDQGYLDTTEGGFYFDVTQPPALEAERLWDFLSTEVVSAMFVQSAWGEYLDMHGEMLGVPRKDEVHATGEVTFSGTDGTLIATNTEVAQGAASPDADPVSFLTTASGTIASGSVTLPVRAADPGPSGNVAVGQITFLLSGVDGVTSVSNAATTSGGADVEDDEAYQQRLLLEWRRPGAAGNRADYERWALAYPGVGYVSVTPVFSGVWTVQVVIADANRNPSSPTVVAALQAFLDPGDGTGDGEAPVGADVTVATITAVTVPIAASLTFSPGYSLDGAGGTVALRAAIGDVLTAYLHSLGPGDDVVLAKVESLFFRVPGVYDVSGVLLNSVAANFAISPTQVAAPPVSYTLT